MLDNPYNIDARIETFESLSKEELEIILTKHFDDDAAVHDCQLNYDKNTKTFSGYYIFLHRKFKPIEQIEKEEEQERIRMKITE